LITQGVQEAYWPTDEFATRMGDDFERAARCFFVSQANLDTTRFQTCCSGSNFEVVRNPFAVAYNVNLDWPDESNGLRMAFVGRLEPGSKGCDLLLRAFASPVWRERPVSLHLYGDGPSQNGVRRLAEFLKLEQVHFHGRVENVEEIWRQNHMLVLSSRFEGLPLAVVEAMLCGRPCLVTDISGNAELLRDGVTGFVASGPTVACVQEALERSWQQRAHWKSMGEAAANDVRNAVPHDPIERFAQRLLGISGAHQQGTRP
jgi:glycosyltransferase involved in cell wall biosynthesis